MMNKEGTKVTTPLETEMKSGNGTTTSENNNRNRRKIPRRNYESLKIKRFCARPKCSTKPFEGEST